MAAFEPPRWTARTTRWTILTQLSGVNAEIAWEWFSSRYRELIYAILRRHLGRDASEAADGFWGYLFESRVFECADRSRSFRAFLRGVVSNYARSWHRGRSGRVGTDPAMVCVVPPLPEEHELELWARHLVRSALKAVRETHPDSADVIEWFYGVTASGEDAQPVAVAEIARRLACKPNAIHQALHRGRERLRAVIENEVRELTSDISLDEELASIFGAIGRASPGLIAGSWCSRPRGA
ncbi:MAG: sigma-70 family RNA polymerase sigma factor [Planctomycetes bacterium]|nr:sigma-70 family RNA polymerase sigma factor [Planctomycetota bacterium]